MKAAVMHGVKEIRIEDVPDPVLEPDGVIIKVKACGICGSDLHDYKRDGKAGTIFGHEFSGDVVEVGSQVQGIKVGMRVTAAGYRPCGKCFWCRQGKGQRCSTMALLGYELPGAMAQFVHVPLAVLGRTIFLLPEELTYEEGALVEPLSVSYYSVRRAQPKQNETAAVIGLGIIGLCAVQVLKTMGVAKIIASDLKPARLAAARICGADLVIDAAKEDVVKKALEATAEMGVNTVVECAGMQTTFHQALAMVQAGGKIMIVGVHEEPLQWDPLSIINGNISLIGCRGGSFTGAIDLLQKEKGKLRHLISHTFPLDQADKAFQVQLNDPQAIKVMLKP